MHFTRQKLLLILSLLGPILGISAMENSGNNVETIKEQPPAVLIPTVSDEDFLKAVKDGNAEEIEALIRKGAGVNAQNECGKTALMWAAANGHLDICRLLIENEADINTQDTSGITALMPAAANGHLDVCKVLIEQMLIGGNVEVARKRFYAILSGLKDKLPKYLCWTILSYDDEILPYLISQVLKGNSKMPAVVMNRVLTVIHERIENLSPIMKDAQSEAEVDEIKNLLNPELFEGIITRLRPASR